MPQVKPKAEPKCLCHKSNRVDCSLPGCVNRIAAPRPTDIEIMAIIEATRGREAKRDYWEYLLISLAMLACGAFFAAGYAVGAG